ncbi:deoxyribonuclease V [Chloroflexota bacterium]
MSNVIINQLHSWKLDFDQAKSIQISLANKVSTKSELLTPRFIAGTDISIPRFSKMGLASVVVLRYPELDVVDIQTTEREISFPYIPGLLSFREVPLIIEAYQKISVKPDILIADGQGIAHPRRFGLASHIGVLLNIPSIGCAKSRLCGQHEPVAVEAGSYSKLIDNEETIGAVVRTKNNVKPVYVSIGHRIDLTSAIHWVMECCRGYRLPEPCRLAHLSAGKKLSSPKI